MLLESIATEVTIPEPIGLYNFGLAYIATANAALASGAPIAFHDPIEHLFAHGLELILKADLYRSRSFAEIRNRFGHDLLALRGALSSEFVSRWTLDASFDEVTCYLAIGHTRNSGYHHRYLQPGVREVVRPERIQSVMSRFDDADRNGLLRFFAKQ